jgi:Cu/Zn superoxide dismutase
VGLAALHRHYKSHLQKEREKAVVLHWGTDDYRPQKRPKNM